MISNKILIKFEDIFFKLYKNQWIFESYYIVL